MAEQLQMLALSPTMEKGVITKWLKKVGDKISEGEVICEVETDKATMDYESMDEGTLLKITVPEGGEAAVGEEIGMIGEEGEQVAGDQKQEESKSQADQQSQQAEDEQAEEGEKKDKQQPEKNDQEQPQKQQPKEQIKKQPEKAAEKESKPKSGVKSTPLARKLAKERGVDISTIEGTGPAGRIVVRDIEHVIESKTDSEKNDNPSYAKKPASTLQDEEIPVSGMRKAIAQRLAESKFSAPHYYLKTSVNAQELITTRNKLKLDSAKKISFNSFLIKLAAEAIKHHPMINSTWKDDKIVKHGSVDIGLAVAIENGLITPIVRDCTNKGIMVIESELQELIELAKNGKLKAEQYEGATFTISNLGSFGIDEFTAIINPPGSAILAVGRIANQPIADNAGNITAQPIMKLTLSCDHRVIDGAVGAAFLSDLKHFTEEPISAFY